MFKILGFLVCFLLELIGCGSAGDSKDVQEEPLSVETLEDLSSCDSTSAGEIYFVEKDSTYYICDENEWRESTEDEIDPVKSSSSSAISSSSFTVKGDSSAPWTGSTIKPTYDSTESCYLVGSGEELAWVTQNETTLCVKLTKNIILNEETFSIDAEGNLEIPTTLRIQWKPTENTIQNFDGNGYAISGLYVDNPDSNYQGLFKRVSGNLSSSIKNLAIVNAYVRGKNYTGGFIGSNAIVSSKTIIKGTKIKDCIFEGTVIGDSLVGGFVGYSNLAIENSSSNGHIFGGISVGGIAGQLTDSATTVSNTGIVNGDSMVGGIIGYATANATLYGLSNEGSVTGIKYVGGILGLDKNDDSVSMSSSYNRGSVNGKQFVGGVAGYFSQSTRYLHNTGSVTGITNVGGLLGHTGYKFRDGLIAQTYNTGKITGDTSVGGILGSTESLYAIENLYTIDSSYNQGDVTGRFYVGGIAGREKINLIHSYNMGKITGTGDYVGGLVGLASDISHCYNEGSVSGMKYIGGLAGKVGNVDSSYNTGKVISDSSVVGGIAGKADTVFDSYNTAKISGYKAIGGIVGGAKNIYRSYNTGDVSANSNVGGILGGYGSVYYSHNAGNIIGKMNYVGGISGQGDVFYSYNQGNVQGTSYIGGLIGQGGVHTSYNMGNVTGIDMCIGGLSGEVYGPYSETLDNSYNVGTVTVSDTALYYGGVIGDLNNKISNTFTNGSLIACGVITGNGGPIANCESAVKTDAEMQTQEFADLLNTDNDTPFWIWDASTNNGYPTLSY